MRKIYFVIFLMFILVLVLSCIYLRDVAMISESNKISYIDDSDIIGSIKIDSIKLSNLLLQGLDNKYYYNHNHLKELSNNGEIFLDYQGDLFNNNNSIIYTKEDNIVGYKNIKKNDKITIFYLYETLCYRVVDSMKNNDLEINAISDKNINKIYAKKVKC